MNYNLYANDKSYAIEKTWILFQSKSLRLILKKNPWILQFHFYPKKRNIVESKYNSVKPLL